MTRKNLIVQTYTIRDFCKTEEDFAVSMQKVAAIGYGGVQISGIGPIEPEKIRKICDANGLDVVTTHRPFTEYATKRKLDELIAYHEKLGSIYPGIGSMPGDIFPRTAEGFAAFGQKMRFAADYLAEHGMHLVYHNHDFEFARCNGKLGHEVIFEYAGDNLMAEIDTFWVTAGGMDPAKFISRFKGRVDVLHCKDYGVKSEGGRMMREVGEGNSDWPAIFAACKEAGVKYFAVEQDDCNGLDPFDCLKTSFDNLRKYLKIK